MIEAALGNGALARTHYQRPKDFHLALGVATLAVLLNTCALVTEFLRAAQSEISASPAVPRLLILVELCLVANVIGLCMRRAVGLFVSLAALLGASGGYALWYVYSQRILGMLSVEHFYSLHPEAVPTHPLGLLGATWLSLVVLALLCTLLIWVARTMLSAAHSPKTL